MDKMIEIDYLSVNSLPDLLALLRDKKVPDRYIWHYVETYRERKARERGTPFSGLFELTPFCNLDCKMCYVHLEKDQMKGRTLLSIDQWKEIMAQAHAMGMMNAELSGGECLTYPGFDDLYLYLRTLGIRTGIKTNGILLKEKADFFDRYPPRRVTVSLYGSSNEVYERVTGRAAFGAVYESLLRLKKASYPVEITVTPSRYLYDDIGNVIALSERLGFPHMINVMLFPPREETGRKLCDITAGEYLEIFRAQKQKAGSSETVPLEDGLLPECGKDGRCEFGLKCGAGRSFFLVDWKGNLKGCENLDSLSVSLMDHPFSDSWEQVHADAVSYPLPMECTDCAYEKVCFDCAAYRGIQAPRGHCNPQICERTKLMVKEGLKTLQ